MTTELTYDQIKKATTGKGLHYLANYCELGGIHIYFNGKLIDCIDKQWTWKGERYPIKRLSKVKAK